MSILLNEKTSIIVQGITGSEGLFHAQQMLDYGSNVVCGVTPGKGGQTAPKGKRMGHAGAIISEGSETADAKIKILKECGVSVAKTVSEIGETMLKLIEE